MAFACLLCFTRINVNCWSHLVAFYDMREYTCPIAIIGDRYDKRGLSKTVDETRIIIRRIPEIIETARWAMLHNLKNQKSVYLSAFVSFSNFIWKKVNQVKENTCWMLNVVVENWKPTKCYNIWSKNCGYN